MKNKYPVTFNSFVFRTIIFVFLLVNVKYAQGMLDTFYHHGTEHYRVTDESFNQTKFRAFIDSVGIEKTDKVICMPDKTPDALLCIIARQGWSEYNLNREDTVAFNNLIKAGAKYLIIQNPFILSEPSLSHYSGNYVGHYENFYVYKFGKGQENIKNKSGIIKIGDKKFISQKEKDGTRCIVAEDSIAAIQVFMISLGDNLVALKAPSGDFVSCDINNGRISIGSGWLGSWEVFKKTELENGAFALKGVNGKYVSLKGNEDNVLIANQETIGLDQTFVFVK